MMELFFIQYHFVEILKQTYDFREIKLKNQRTHKPTCGYY